MGQTPLEQTFLNYDREPRFLEEVVNLPYFKNRTLQDYETSCGNLLHVAMKYGYRDSILWFIKHGFDANAPNEKGENTLFCCLSSQRKYHFDYMCDTQAEFVDEFAVKLIKAGAQVDVENNEGDTIVTSALRNRNYRLINTLIQTQSVSPKVLSKILAPRMKHGLNALHYAVQKMVSVVGSIQDVDKEMRIFHLSDYPVARHCALLCLEHYPEMLYERSDASDEKTLKHVCDVSPLQILLRARHGLHLLNELSIKLSDIANQPVFKSKNSDVTAPIPLMYLASEHIGRTIIIPMFEELMNYTDSESKQMVQQLLEMRDTKNREKKRLKRKTSSDTDGSSELLTSEQSKKRRTNQF